MKKKVVTTLTLLLATVSLFGCSSENNIQSLKDWEFQDSIIEDKFRNFYEIYVRSFYDADGNGYGDIRGVGKKMKYIHDLGYDGIWLMPIHPSISYHKYDVDDYYKIDKEYIVYNETDDFNYMIEEANKYDISVVMDLVINHSSARHAWFKEAVKGLNSSVCVSPTSDGRPSESCLKAYPTIGYYNFYYENKVPRDNTYRKINSSSSWYYESGFSENMPDLNLDNESLRAEIVQIMKYWMDKGVKGFRLDAAYHFYNKNSAKNIAFLKWLNQEAKKVAPKGVNPYFVAEVWSGKEEQNYYASGMDSFFNFSFSGGSGVTMSSVTKENAKQFVTSVVSYEKEVKKIYSDAVIANFLGNHDMQRSANAATRIEDHGDGTVSRYISPDYIKMSLALNQMISGSSWTYYGEEIGMLGASSGGDPSYRTAMLWSDDQNELCLNPSGAQVREQDYGNDYTPGNVEEQLNNPQSILNFLKIATRLRYRYKEIARGEQDAIILDDDACAILTKKYEGKTTYLVINLSPEMKTISLDETLKATKIQDTLATNYQNAKRTKDSLNLQPFSITILK